MIKRYAILISLLLAVTVQAREAALMLHHGRRRGPKDVTEGLVAKWSMNTYTANSTTFVRDEVGDNDGTAVNNPSFGPEYGVVGDGAKFEEISPAASAQHIDFGTGTILGQTQALSMSVWFYTEDTDQGGVILTIGTEGSTSEYDTWLSLLTDARVRYGLRNTDNVRPVLDSTNTFNYSQWNHIVGTWDGTTMEVFVNTVSGGTASQSGTHSDVGRPKVIGARNDGGGGATGGAAHHGYIDEVRIYDRALSPAEIKAIYELEKP